MYGALYVWCLGCVPLDDPFLIIKMQAGGVAKQGLIEGLLLR